MLLILNEKNNTNCFLSGSCSATFRNSGDRALSRKADFNTKVVSLLGVVAIIEVAFENFLDCSEVNGRKHFYTKFWELLFQAKA